MILLPHFYACPATLIRVVAVVVDPSLTEDLSAKASLPVGPFVIKAIAGILSIVGNFESMCASAQRHYCCTTFHGSLELGHGLIRPIAETDVKKNHVRTIKCLRVAE